MKLSGLLLFALAAGGDGSASVEVVPPEEGWTAEALIREASAARGELIAYDPSDGHRTEFRVCLTGGPRRIPRSRLFDLYRSLLVTRRVILLPQGPEGSGYWAALDRMDPRVTSRPVHVPPEELSRWAGRDGAYVVTVLSLRGVTDREPLRNFLARIASRTIGRANAVPEAASMLVGNYAPAAAAMEKLVATVRGESRPSDLPPPARAGARTVRLPARRRGWRIPELIEEVARRSGATFAWDSFLRSRRGKRWGWREALEIPEDRLVEWLGNVLSSRGYALVPLSHPEDRIFEVLDTNSNSTRWTERPVFLAPDDVESFSNRGGLYVVTAVRVPHLEDTEGAGKALEALSTNRIGRVTGLPNARWFLLADTAPIVARMCRILKALDAISAKE